MKARFLLAAAVCLSVAYPLSAYAQGATGAQPWLEDRRYGEGIGIRTGNLELHPSIAGQVGYDTNYFQRSGSDLPTEQESAAYRFRLTPSLTLNTLRSRLRGQQVDSPTIGFTANVSATYIDFIAADGDDSGEFSDQRNVGIDAGGNLDILPGQRWSGDVGLQYKRTIEPSNNPDTNLAFDRNTIVGRTGVTWSPGGGLFNWRVGYQVQAVLFEREAFRDYNNLQHEVNTRGRWRFLPRTALLYDTRVGFLNYSREGTDQANSNPIRSRVGLNGLITSRLALLAMIGWGTSFYESKNGAPVRDFDSVIGETQLTWYVLSPQAEVPDGGAPTGLSTVSLGYRREFFNSYLGNFYQVDRGFLKANYLVGGRFVMAAEGGLSHVRQSPAFFDDGTLRNDEYTENRVDGQLFGEYRLSDTFGLNLTYRVDVNITDATIPLQPGPNPVVDELEFTRHQVYLGARWFM